MNQPLRHRPGRRERTGTPPDRGAFLVAEFDALRDRMSRLLETAGRRPAGGSKPHPAPPADVHETDDAYVVEAELPGVPRDAIDVEIGNRELRISGAYEECERAGVLRRSTRRTGRFEFRSLLPVDVRTDEVTAGLTDGVLTVTLPKARPVTPRRVEITGRPG